MKEKLRKLNKMNLSYIVAIFLCLIFMGSIIIIGFIGNLPVQWDAGACGGGYSAFIFDKYSDVLTQKFVEGVAKHSDFLSAEAIKGTQEAEWKDKTIFLKFDIRCENFEHGVSTETVCFVGKRIWFDTYVWTSAPNAGN